VKAGAKGYLVKDIAPSKLSWRESPDGLVKAPESTFKKSTVNRYLKRWAMTRLRRQPVAVGFQAEHSNDCWQFDLSPSDLKEIKKPLWLQPNRSGLRT
jgi:hypothetical protein